MKISRFSTNKSLYLANDARYRHSYYGRWIGTHMRSIKWCHFWWPWTNPNPVFKVTPLFDAKYLTNGYRYGHSYYIRRIGNHTQAFDGTNFNDLEWPLTQISRSRYYATSVNSKMVQDSAIFTMVGRPIEFLIWSIKWRHFQWPWTTPNLVLRSRHSLTLHILQTATDTATVTIEGE